LRNSRCSQRVRVARWVRVRGRGVFVVLVVVVRSSGCRIGRSGRSPRGYISRRGWIRQIQRGIIFIKRIVVAGKRATIFGRSIFVAIKRSTRLSANFG
jgi:hypothetical protein